MSKSAMREKGNRKSRNVVKKKRLRRKACEGIGQFEKTREEENKEAEDLDC